MCLFLARRTLLGFFLMDFNVTLYKNDTKSDTLGWKINQEGE